MQDFMAKPYIIKQGVFSNQAVESSLFSADIKDLLLANPVWLNKIAGYNLFRATACFKVTLNANPYQQGRLLFHFLPCISTSDAERQQMNNKHMIQKLQHPHVEIDMRDTSAILKCKYLTPTSYYDMFTNTYDWGSIYLDVLSLLRVGATAPLTVNYTIYMYFEDVELAAPLYPESSHGSFGGSMRKHISSSNFQVQEQKEANPGVIGSMFQTGVDAISSVGNLVGGVLHTGGALAGLFGLSKPLDLQPVVSVAQHPLKHSMNDTGVNDCDVLAMSPNSHLPFIPGFAGSEVDEMSFDFLKGIPTLIDRFTISTSDLAGDNKYIAQVSPNEQSENFVKIGTVGSANYTCYGPMGYLSNFCPLWRGGITYTFKFIKTENHTVRLEFIFIPNASGSVITVAQSNYCTKEVHDIRDNSEITITCPFMRNQSYLRTRDLSSDTTILTKSGTLYVKVVNPLQAPTTCAQQIECLVYSSGASDLELCGISNYATGNVFSPESGTTTTDAYISNTTASNLPLSQNDSCVGDQFKSIKQFFNMLCRFPTTFEITGQDFNIVPFFYPYTKSRVNTTGTPLVSSCHDDYIAFFSLGYAFARGGMRITIPMGIDSSDVDTIKTCFSQLSLRSPIEPLVSNYNEAYPLITWPTGAQHFPGAVGFSNNPVGPLAITNTERAVMDVIVPGSSLTPMRIIRPAMASYNNTHPSYTDDPIYVVKSFLRGVSITYSTLMRSGADDYCVGFFIGFPPLLNAYTAN